MSEITGKKCKATRENGQACGAWALEGKDYCFAHDPENAHKRAKARKLGGYNRQTPHSDPYSGPRKIRTLTDVLNVLDYVLAETLQLENSITRGRLLVALCAEYTNAIKTGELENRLEVLEAILKAREK